MVYPEDPHNTVFPVGADQGKGLNLQQRDLEDLEEAQSLTCLPEIDKDFSTSAKSRFTPSTAVEETIVLVNKISRCFESLR